MKVFRDWGGKKKTRESLKPQKRKKYGEFSMKQGEIIFYSRIKKRRTKGNSCQKYSVGQS